MKTKKITQDKVVYFLNYIFLTLMLIIVLYPIIYIISCSFSSGTALMSGKVKLFPVEATLQSYKAVFEYKSIWVGYRNSMIYTVLGTVLSVVLTLLAAYPLSREDFRGGKVFMSLFLFTMMFSGGLIPWYMTMKNYGLINSVFGLAVCGGLPIYNMILMINFFESISKELEEAAIVDGAGPWRILFSIVLPISKPILATIALFTIVSHWNEFFQGYVLSTKIDYYPLQSYIKQMVVQIDYSSITEDQLANLANLSNTALNSAKIFVSMLPILAIYPFLQKYFVSGIMLGGVKE